MRKLAVMTLTVLLVVAACGTSEADRPGTAEWTPKWVELRDIVPDPATIEDKGVEVCSGFLGEVRERRADVIPTPDEGLDDPVTEWVAEAETVGLDCDREGDLAERLSDLHKRSDEIDARIDLLSR
ncbi:hypothetical protein [Actinospongicola halichondriae]|uniref:hypothetical protein n=1 Tax=Actinospongicola halichondriae TaxID=3236844 RepID=UPI003D40154A